ncbi:MAG: hypothetical protein JWM27_2678 [Gemmatimonadetes bacterium]|nr:hypothetical protein [Gemmatimonadota bacterium]
MTSLAFAAALFMQVTPASLPPDTAQFDTPATHVLVVRVIGAGSNVPPALRDYAATLRSAVYLAVRPDSAPGGELPVTIDEFAGRVQWERGGTLVQTVTGHREKLLAPTPYTIGTMLESPWVIPHLYGNTIDIFQLAPTPANRTRVSRAVHPFSPVGLAYYRYTAGDTVRIRTQQGVTTLVPVTVQRLARAPRDRAQLVAGTFYVDVDRAAVARARFGFEQRGGGAVSLTETGFYFELESGLVDGRWWLPYRQRREVQLTSPVFGGAAAIRLVTTLSDFHVNTGWTPVPAGRSRLASEPAPRGSDPFAGWNPAVGQELGGVDIADFADLRESVHPQRGGGPVKVGLRYERGEHLFRYNRVEGAYVGAGVLAQPRAAASRTWDAYATAGWAFAEGTPRGEVDVRRYLSPGAPKGSPAWTLQAGAYRRLRNPQVFRPPLAWEIGYSLNALLSGVDERDYYDAAGGEGFAIRRSGPWSLRLGGRVERQDSVSLNTHKFLFGTATRFPSIGAADPGTHAALEGELGYARGAGAFALGNSVVASLGAEAGLGDFRFERVTARLATRLPTRFVTLALRGDAGVMAGDPPPQYLFRFGGTEGLIGYPLRAFGGTAAVLGRARVLLHLPPYGSRPLYRIGFFAVPPLRPALVASGNAGWSSVSDRSKATLARLGAEPTDGVRTSYGGGISLFEDAVSAEYVVPASGGKGKWYVGFVQWF